MINNNMISSKSVIAKILADLDLKEDQIKISDFYEWITEALLKIGALQQFNQKVVVLPILEGRVKLPCDLYQLGQVAFSFDTSRWFAMRKTTSSFSIFGTPKNNPQMLITDDALIPIVKTIFNISSDLEALEKLNSDINMKQILSTLINQYTTDGISNSTFINHTFQYDTKPGYIFTSMFSGYLKIAYKAIYVDEDGLPLIPDMESFKEAIYWYVTMKFLYPKKLKGQISQQDYYDIRNSYNFYRRQAYAEAMMPTVDDLTSIKNTIVKLYPEQDEEDTFFEYTGDRQLIYNQN